MFLLIGKEIEYDDMNEMEGEECQINKRKYTKFLNLEKSLMPMNKDYEEEVEMSADA